jgi:hypothetical protein
VGSHLSWCGTSLRVSSRGNPQKPQTRRVSRVYSVSVSVALAGIRSLEANEAVESLIAALGFPLFNRLHIVQGSPSSHSERWFSKASLHRAKGVPGARTIRPRSWTTGRVHPEGHFQQIPRYDAGRAAGSHSGLVQAEWRTHEPSVTENTGSCPAVPRPPSRALLGSIRHGVRGETCEHNAFRQPSLELAGLDPIGQPTAQKARLNHHDGRSPQHTSVLTWNPIVSSPFGGFGIGLIFSRSVIASSNLRDGVTAYALGPSRPGPPALPIEI